MIANVLRDARLIPSVAAAAELNFGPFAGAAVNVLASGWEGDGARQRRRLAALMVALDFQTWETLTKRARLGDDEAVALIVDLVESV